MGRVQNSQFVLDAMPSIRIGSSPAALHSTIVLRKDCHKGQQAGKTKPERFNA